ncbi:MAG: hypothetical protein R2716_07140 [Microthrixaceae bacterium]
MLDAADSPVFCKDMAYHLSGMLTRELMSRFRNTFLIREPLGALRSLARKWPDFTEEEAGYGALGLAFDLAAAGVSGGGPDRDRAPLPLVIDADELAADPGPMVEAWCEAVGIPFLPGALEWEPGMVPQWTRWQDWYRGVAASSGFVRPQSCGRGAEDEIELDPGVVARCAEVYERLRAARLRP